MNPFVDVRVIPTYGKFSVRLIWKLLPGYINNRFIVFRSRDGLNWEEYGTTLSTDFEDTQAITGGKIDNLFYKIVCQSGGRRYDSDTISTLGGDVTKAEFAAARYIMHQEYKVMQQCSKVLFLKARREEPCSKCVDPQTGQKVGIALCKTCWGTGFDGGYWPPVTTFMRHLSVNPQAVDHSQEGAGVTDVNRIRALLLAFPPALFDDLIIDRDSDTRYLVEVADLTYLKAKIPMFSKTTMLVLRRNDIRYQIPV